MIKGQKQDLACIMDIISECKKHMESEGIFQWNEFYPTIDIVKGDIDSGECYILKDNENGMAYVAINEEQPEEYGNIEWSINVDKVLVIHRLCVHPNFQGKGLAKVILKFVEEYCSKNGYSCIRLDAYSGNEIALKLYEHYGYENRGQVIFPWRKLPFNCYEKRLVENKIYE